MDINYLKELIALDKTRSYVEAADERLISQSSLSRHIAAMEDELGVKLFVRNSRFVCPTVYGEKIIPIARKIVACEEEYLNLIREEKEMHHSAVKIGAVFGLERFGIMKMIAAFAASHDAISVSISHRQKSGYKDMLAMGAYDFLIIFEDNEPDDSLNRVTLDTDRVTVLLPQRHRLAAAATVSVQDLKDEKWILQKEKKALQKRLNDLFRINGITPKESEINSYGINVSDLVEHGAGIAAEMEKMTSGMISSKVVAVPLEGINDVRLNLVWNPQNLSDAGRQFLSYIKRHI